MARMLARFRCECVAMCYSVECGAVCCSTTMTWQEYWLASCVSVLQRVAACCNMLQCGAMCCSVLMWVALCYSIQKAENGTTMTWQTCWLAAGASVLQCVAVWCNVLQSGALCRCVWCSVLQYDHDVARVLAGVGCCSVLQPGALFCNI